MWAEVTQNFCMKAIYEIYSKNKISIVLLLSPAILSKSTVLRTFLSQIRSDFRLFFT